MKRFFIVLSCLGLLTGCECSNDNVPPTPNDNREHHIPHGNPWVEPQDSVGFEKDAMNVLPFPFELSDESVNANGEHVWHYHYEEGVADEENLQYRVNFIMHCNHTIDFDFINYPMIYEVISSYETSSGTDRDMYNCVASGDKLFPEISDFYYSSYRDCKHVADGESQYEYEIEFPLLFPKVGKYDIYLQLMSFDDRNGNVYETLYSYKTPRYVVEIQEDSDGETNDGGVVILMSTE